MEGFIQIHRKILEWEWYDDINTKVLFIHLLLKANFKEKVWRGINIEQGEVLTGRIMLSDETGLTQQQIRTSLNKLKSTNEITIKTTNKYSIIKLINYNKYQQLTSKTPNKQPTSNQQVTTTNNDNKDNKDNNIISKEITKQEFGNEEINNIQEIIKQEVLNLGLVYKKGRYERERIKNILTGKDYGEICKLSNMERLEFTLNILRLSTKLDFWNGKVYNAETIYKHYPQIYNEGKRIRLEREKNKPLVC